MKGSEMLTSTLNIPIIKLMNMAQAKLFISKPSTSLLEKVRIKALITHVNNPSVSMVIGKAKSSSIGLTSKFKQVNTNATQKAVW